MDIQARIHHIQADILQAELNAKRKPGCVSLVAVSKGQSIQKMEQALHAGLNNFGESYFQEAYAKMQHLKQWPICWHFIGPVQSNKAKLVAQHFSWVHSLCRIKIAQLLHEARPVTLAPLKVCLQVNFNEPQKSGVAAEDIKKLIMHITPLSRIQLCGLMFIPPKTFNDAQKFHSFFQVAQLLADINQQFHLDLNVLSMGMSDDFRTAIQAGSTMIRIGTGIFGNRKI